MEEMNNNINPQTINNQATENNNPPTEPIFSSKPENKFKPLFFIIFLLLIGVILVIFLLIKSKSSIINQTNNQTPETPSQAIVENEESLGQKTDKSEISVFKEGGTLYFSDSNNNKVKVSDNVGNFSLSNDKLKIAYVADRMVSDQDLYFYLYQISDNSTQKVPVETEITPTAISWSPNDQYLALDYGTDVIRSIKFFKYLDKKEILEIQAFVSQEGKTIDWLDMDTFVFGEVQKVTPEIPAGSGSSCNISKMSITTKQKEVLQKADSLTIYSLIGVKNNLIYFKKMSVVNHDDWMNPDKQETKYWQIDSKGDSLTQISEEVAL